MTYGEFIEKLGGGAEVGRQIGVTRQAVNHWVQTGRVPKWHRKTLERLASAAGVAMPAPQESKEDLVRWAFERVLRRHGLEWREAEIAADMAARAIRRRLAS